MGLDGLTLRVERFLQHDVTILGARSAGRAHGRLDAAGCGGLLPTMEATAAVLNINVGQVRDCICDTGIATINPIRTVGVDTEPASGALSGVSHGA